MDKAILPIESCVNAKKIISCLQSMSKRPEEFIATLAIDKAIARAETMFKELKNKLERSG